MLCPKIDEKTNQAVAEIIVKNIHNSFFCHLYGAPLFMRVSRAKKSTTIVIPHHHLRKFAPESIPRLPTLPDFAVGRHRSHAAPQYGRQATGAG